MKVLSFTGGSTQGVGLSAIGCGIMQKGYEPDIIIGESVSSIFAIPLAMKKMWLIKKAMLKFRLKDIFGKYKPLNKANTFPSIRGLWRLITGKDSLGKQDKLISYIKRYLTEKLFNEWKEGVYGDKYPEVLVATTNLNTMRLEYFHLSDYSYENALNIILASCNIPVLINGIKINGCYHYDGGLIKANAGIEFLKHNQRIIKEYRSVWARSKTPKVDVRWKPKGFKIISVALVEA